jgi:hypothetical protein
VSLLFVFGLLIATGACAVKGTVAVVVALNVTVLELTSIGFASSLLIVVSLGLFNWADEDISFLIATVKYTLSRSNL